MALDGTAREANVRDSVKKFFVDSLVSTSNLRITFDKGLAVPVVQGTSVVKWVSIMFDSIDLDTVSSQELKIICCTKQDSEGFKLAQLRDTVMGYLTDSNQNDGIRRVALYRSHATDAWVLIGAMMVYVHPESEQLTASDETKFKIISVTLKWGTII